MGIDGEPPPAAIHGFSDENARRARSLEVVKEVYADPGERANFRDDAQDTFDRKKASLEPGLQSATYGDLPPKVRHFCEQASEEEMDFLSKLDETFVGEGLSVEVPSPGLLHMF
jgi:hypothetical protein